MAATGSDELRRAQRSLEQRDGGAVGRSVARWCVEWCYVESAPAGRAGFILGCVVTPRWVTRKERYLVY